MGASQRPIFDPSVDQAPAQPIFPTSVQAQGMPTAPAPTAGFAAGLGGAADAMQNYRDVAIGKLARIHAMVDAGQLPQTALADPSLQPLFHQAGLDQEGHLALLPKISDITTQQKAAELNTPDFNTVGSPGSRASTDLPQESTLDVQGSLNKSTKNPDVAQVISKAPTPTQAGNTLETGNITSRAELTDAGTALEKAKTKFQVAADAAKRYDKSGDGKDPVYRNAMQVAEEGLIPYYVELMKQQTAAAMSSAADKKSMNDFLLGIGPRADAALTARHATWVEDRQKYFSDLQTANINSEDPPDVQKQKVDAAMAEYERKFPEPTLPDILDDMMHAQGVMVGVPETALRLNRAKRVGFPQDAGATQPGELGLFDTITSQLKYSKMFTIDAPPGTTTTDPQTGKRVPVPPGSRITGNLDWLLNSNDPWVTPSLKAQLRNFEKRGYPMTAGAPGGANGGTSSGHTPLNPGGVGQGAQPSTRAKVTPPATQ